MSRWQQMANAPHDRPIQALYEDSADDEFDTVIWEENRYCMIGPPQGSRGPGWQSLENNLPVDDPVLWREVQA